MQLISDSLKESLWNQIEHEFENAKIYLFIYAWLKNKGLDNIAKLFKKQYKEENSHANMLIDLMTDLSTPVSLLETPKGDFPINSCKDIADKFLQREIETTESLCEIKDQAIEEGNGVVEEAIRVIIALQQHEYEEATTFADQIELFGGNWGFIALWDKELD